MRLSVQHFGPDVQVRVSKCLENYYIVIIFTGYVHGPQEINIFKTSPTFPRALSFRTFIIIGYIVCTWCILPNKVAFMSVGIGSQSLKDKQVNGCDRMFCSFKTLQTHHREKLWTGLGQRSGLVTGRSRVRSP